MQTGITCKQLINFIYNHLILGQIKSTPAKPSARLLFNIDMNIEPAFNILSSAEILKRCQVESSLKMPMSRPAA